MGNLIFLGVAVALVIVLLIYTLLLRHELEAERRTNAEYVRRRDRLHAMLFDADAPTLLLRDLHEGPCKSFAETVTVRHDVKIDDDSPFGIGESVYHRLVVDGREGPWVGGAAIARYGPLCAATELHTRSRSLPRVFMVVDLIGPRDKASS